MRYLLVVICLLLTLKSNGQEKRLAWVIGNSNYEKGFLKNPVNDALLVAKTLKELNFTVLLDTNIATYRDFCNAVNRYGEQRGNFNIGFIYYAGHGVQINNENYLLATKEEYNDENNVGDYGLSIQRILKYIEDKSSEVNVLILDACRDNPFEKTWKTTGRSLEVSRGLAKANPPTGSLIAYSTDAGNIAADGTGKNSIYCLSLIKNMQIENLALDQVFRNVRGEVLKLSEGKQRPVEASQLTGEAFYLKKGNYIEQIKQIDSLITAENYTLALQNVTSILTQDANNKMALCRKGQLLVKLQGENYDGSDFFNVVKLYPNDAEPFIYLGRYFKYKGQYDKAISQFEKAINIDTTNIKVYFYRAAMYENTNEKLKALNDFNKVIGLEPNNDEGYFLRGDYFEKYENDYQKALNDYSNAIKLKSSNIDYLYARGILYLNKINNYYKALDDFNLVLEIDSSNIDAINAIGVLYQRQNQISKAISIYDRGIALEKLDSIGASFCYENRGALYQNENLLDKAISDYNKAISLNPNNPNGYALRASFYQFKMNDCQKALIDISKAIELNNQNLDYIFSLGNLFSDCLGENQKAIESFNKILELDSSNIHAINSIGRIYQKENQLEKAILTFEKGIVLEKLNPIAAAFCYTNRGLIYAKINLLDKALSDFNKAIELDPNNYDRYSFRADYYIDYKKDYIKSINDYSKALELNPQNILSLSRRANLYKNYLKNNSKALEDYNKILLIDSNNIQVINEIGKIYESEKQFNKALQYFNKGISLEKINPNGAALSYLDRAKIYEANNNFMQALLDYNKAVQLDSKNPQLYINRGKFYSQKLDSYYNSLVDFTIALSLDSTNNVNWKVRADLFSNCLGNHIAAIDDCKKILEIDSNDAVILNWIGVYYHRMGDKANAIEYYEKTISKMNCNFKDSIRQFTNGICWSYFNLALIFQENMNYDSALVFYNNSIKYDPATAIRYFFRGYFLSYYLNDTIESKKDINIAIKLDSNNPYLYFQKFNILKKNNESDQAINSINKAISYSNNNALYLAERGNYYRERKNYKLAERDLNAAIILDSNISAVYYYKILFLKDNCQFQEAIKVAKQSLLKFRRDTIANYLLGEIYFEQKYYFKSLDYFLNAISIMELDSNYKTKNGLLNMVYLSNTYQKVGEVYQLLGDKELPKEYYAKALIALKDEIRPDKLLKEKELQDLLKQ